MAKTTKNTQAVEAQTVKTAAELRQEVSTLETKVAQAKVENRMGKLHDRRSISRMRDEIARLKTALRMMELESIV